MSRVVTNLPEESSISESTMGGALQLDPNLERVLTRVRLRAKRRTAWLRKLWSEEGESGGNLAVTHAEIDTLLADRDSPAAEAEWFATHESVTQLNRDLAQLEIDMAADDQSRLARLQQIFGLKTEDMDILQACLALALDPSLGRVYAYLQDHAARGYVTENLVSRLFGYGRGGIWNTESPLRRWALVQEREVAVGEPPLLSLDAILSDWLQGRPVLDPRLTGVAEIHAPLDPLRDWPIEEVRTFIERTVNADIPGHVRIQIAGAVGSGRRTFAAVACSKLGLPLLVMDSDIIDEDSWQEIYMRAQRQAYLDRTALAWAGETALQRPWPKEVLPFPIQFIVLEPNQAPLPHSSIVEHRLNLPALALTERNELWRRYVPESATWSPQDYETLVQRYRTTVGDIATAANIGLQGPTDAMEFVREKSRYQLGKLAQRVECPYKWDDLVIPDRVRQGLEDLVFEAENRATFWERPEVQRLYPQGRGLLALFSGPSGTGKTMSAQVIAARLGLDLFRIDLSAVVSKYVGETSQNLERIMSRAQGMDIVLLFDEFDALGGKRTEIKDAHDRFANTDTNYLLQAIEDYRGLAVLSTNKKSNIDSAFLRRIRYVLEFPKPDAEQRFAIWQHLLNELVGTAQLKAKHNNGLSMNDNLGSIATALELTGAQIKFSVLTGLFAARREGVSVTLKHLLHGVDRELMKDGRALSERDKKRLLVS